VEGIEPESLLVSEYKKSRSLEEDMKKDAEQTIKQLLEICYVGKCKNKKEEKAEKKSLFADGALLLKFLSSPETEGDE
ncbi:MAG: hypothetical protein QXT63_09350, partial [Thermoplasmata archaeon]